MKKIISIFLVLFLLIFISGCSKPECPTDSTYEKFSYNEDLKECVSTKIEKDECGNGVAEESDGGYCTCPEDISKSHPKYGCFGSYGEYLEQSCVDNSCVYSQNDKVVEETKAIELKNSDITLDGLFTLNNPFILNTQDKNKIKIDISFLKIGSDSKKIKNLVVKEIRLEDGSSKILASATYNEDLANVGDELSTKQLALSDTDEYKDSISIKIKVMVSYTLETYKSSGELSDSEDKIETISASLGRVTVINPNFEVQ